MKIILASQSPRRLEILRKHGYEPIVIPSNAEEVLPDNISMLDAVKTLSKQKAQAVYESNPELRNEEELTIIIGSDTIVYKDEIMSKPQDANDAYRMLNSIRNTSHYVATGVTLIYAQTGEILVLSDVTTVYCKDYTDDDIWRYIKDEPPFDKAGSYAIQGRFGQYIDHIDGDYENVMGLPFHIIKEFLE